MLPPTYTRILERLLERYEKEAGKGGLSVQETEQLMHQLLLFSFKQMKDPYPFEIFHEPLRTPFDYYQFGLDFIRPLIDFKHSTVQGIDQLKKIEAQHKANENVILLANHQTEPDPQIIDLLIEPYVPGLGKEIIFIAGHRVTTDPLAVPFSMGRRILSVFSKKHIDFPPEEKNHKIVHNQRTMVKLHELLSQGGQCIYVAPSGGRDRMNAEGKIEMDPFDPQSIELFHLMTQQTNHPTHFYPLAMATYALLPPPRQIEQTIGEERCPTFTPVHLYFGEEIDMDHFAGGEVMDKKTKRMRRADYIWNLTQQLYKKIEPRG